MSSLHRFILSQLHKNLRNCPATFARCGRASAWISSSCSRTSVFRYQLGEHGEWAKHNTTELSTRIPLLVRAPDKTKPGTSTRGLVETVDLYPTLCELAGLPIRPELEGASFAPLFADPQRAWKKAAFSVWPMRGPKAAGRRKDTGLGRAMRTDRYRFVEWGGEFELYDHQTDPEEHLNLANKPEHKELVAQLTAQLHAGWRAALPEPRP